MREVSPLDKQRIMLPDPEYNLKANLDKVRRLAKSKYPPFDSAEDFASHISGVAEMYGVMISTSPYILINANGEQEFDGKLDLWAAGAFGFMLHGLTTKECGSAMVYYDRFIDVFKDSFIASRMDDDEID